MDSIKAIKDYIEKNLSEKRRIHTEGVRKTAIELAKLYGADEKKAEEAALFHDMYRGLSAEILNGYVKQLGLDDKYLNNCNLAHGKIAAVAMRDDFDIQDPDILNAVSYHTTGRPGMSKLEKIIYIADAIEPNRDYPGVEQLRKAAFQDLDKACLMSLSNTIDFVTSKGNFLDEETILAKEYFEHIITEKEAEHDK